MLRGNIDLKVLGEGKDGKKKSVGNTEMYNGLKVAEATFRPKDV